MVGRTLRKCFELSGVVPLAVFLVVHVASYSQVLFGGERFGVAPAGRFWFALELLFVWIPLAFHAVLGARIGTEALPTLEPARTHSWLLRASGVVVLLFVILHAFWFRLPLATGELDGSDVPQLLAAQLSTTWSGLPVIAGLHLLGLGAVALHLYLGLARFLLTWGVASELASRRFGMAVALFLFALGAATVLELATGSFIPRFLVRAPPRCVPTQARVGGVTLAERAPHAEVLSLDRRRRLQPRPILE